ncbi:MAG: tyrosine recombinase XerD [Armatimonadota bacterium]|nr:MAG: tyrosine recombinase XerD [Armatimonadota bacterium]
MRGSASDRFEFSRDVVNPDSLAWLMKDYLIYLQATRKTKTVRMNATNLKRFLDWCNQHGVETIQQLQPRHIREWQYELQQSCNSRATAWSIAVCVRAFLNWLVSEEVISKPPFRRGDWIPKPKPNPKPLSVEDVQKLFAAAQGDTWIHQRDRALLTTLLSTGARRAEILQMTVGDVERRSFTVIQKGDRTHILHLTAETIREIRKYLRAYVKATGRYLTDDDPLWWSQRGEPMTGNALRMVMRHLSQRSGVRVWCHRLRMTSATMRLAMGASTEAVRQQLGHADIRSVEHYVKLAREDLARLLEQTDPLKLIRRRPEL